MDEIREIAKSEFGDKAATARMPWKTDAETGEIVIITKSKFKPKIVDSAGHMIRDDQTPPIYGGSTLKLAGTIYPYKQGGNVGVSLQLAGVQIIDLVSRFRAVARSASPRRWRLRSCQRQPSQR